MTDTAAAPHTIPVNPPIVAKPITITLTWYIKDYKVAATTNYLGHKPGDWISPQEAADMNARPGWTVITADNQLLSELTGALVTNVVKAIPIPTI